MRKRIILVTILTLIVIVGGVGIGLAWKTDYLDRWLPANIKEMFGREDLTKDWETYRDELLGFEMKYPKDWEVAVGTIIKFSKTFTKDSTKFHCGFQVQDEGQEEFEDVRDQYTATWDTQSVETIAGVSATKLTDSQLQGLAIYLFESEGGGRFFYIWSEMLQVEGEGFWYLDVPECRDTYNKMLATFKLFDPTLTCVDTDGGYKPPDKGTVKAKFGGDFFKSVADYCWDATDPGNQVWVEECQGLHCFQVEGVCNLDGTGTTGKLPCPKGCRDGVCVDWEEPSITITSPNGGETWKIAKKHRITWDSAGVDAVTIGYLHGGGSRSIAALDDNPGYYDWTIPFDLDLSWGVLYKIQVRAHNIRYLPSGADQLVSPEDESDDYFTITLDKCIDTDGGKNYYVKGFTRGYQDESHQKIIGHWDSCNTCFGDGTCTGDQDTGEGVVEGTCDENDIIISPYYECPNGCKDGVCVK